MPYILVIGDKEAEQNVVAVRHRTDGDLGVMSVDDFAKLALMEVATKHIK